MTILTLTALIFCAPQQALGVGRDRDAHAGYAKFYSPGVAERVLHNRHLHITPGVTGLASTPDCSWIGVIVLGWVNGRLERLLVVDCSNPSRDRVRHIREGLVVETDYRTAVRDDFENEGKTRAIVWREEP